MSEEVKTNVDDAKDFAHQAGLEAKIKARQLADRVEKTMLQKADKEPVSERMGEAAASGYHAAKDTRDVSKQVGLEVRKQARDAKLAVDKKLASSGTSQAASHAGDKLVDAKDKLVDALTPDTKVVAAESTRGVDISHVENTANARVEARRKEEQRRQERDAEFAQEQKRQQLVDDSKAKLGEVKAVVSEKAEAVGSVLQEVADAASIALGNAALSLKGRIDESMDDRPSQKVTPRVSERGVDISAVQNARNDDLLEEQRRVREAQKDLHDKPLGEVVKEKLQSAASSLKQSYEEATTDPPRPLYVHKVSEGGIDVSHVENANNAALAAREEEQLRREREQRVAEEKAALDAKLVQPGKAALAEQSDDLKGKMAQLGDSISRAAHKLADSVKEKYNELAHPLPMDVHEKRSDSGVDTTSIANARNNEIGEEIKNRPILDKLNVTSSSSSSSSDSKAKSAASKLVSTSPKDAAKAEVETQVIKKVLDAGVAVREAIGGAKDSIKQASSELSSSSSGQADVVVQTVEVPPAAAPVATQPLAPINDTASARPASSTSI